MVIFFVIFEKRKINIRRTIACYTRAYNKQVTQNVCMHNKKKWNKFLNLQKKRTKTSIALVLWWYFSCSNYYLILCSMIFKREHSKARAPRLHYLLFVLVMLWSCDHSGLYISVSDRVSDIRTTLKVILQKHRYVVILRFDIMLLYYLFEGCILCSEQKSKMFTKPMMKLLYVHIL